MKIAIDVSHIDRDGAGIGYVIKGLLEGFKKLPEHEYIVYSRNPLQQELPDNFRVVVIPHVRRIWGGGFKWYSLASQDARAQSVDVFISPTLNISSMFVMNSLQIINDLTPISHPQYYRWQDSLRFRLTLLATVRSAKWLAAISHTTAVAVQQTFPWLDKYITVIPLGLNSWVYAQPMPAEIETVVKKHNLPEKYFFSISTIQPRKNYEGMIAAFAEFSKSHPEYHYLIAGGKGWYYEQVFELVQKLNLESKVQFLGYAAEADLPVLYDRAVGILYASHAEGYGLIVTEAMARGVPVLTSDLPVIKEITDDKSAVFVDPSDVKSIAQGLEELVTRKHYQPAPEFFAKHNWANTASTLLASVHNEE